MVRVNVSWNFDGDGFRREVERTVKREYRKKLNQLSRTHKGRDQAEIVRAIRQALDLKRDPPEGWVEAIQGGRRFDVQVRW